MWNAFSYPSRHANQQLEFLRCCWTCNQNTRESFIARSQAKPMENFTMDQTSRKRLVLAVLIFPVLPLLLATTFLWVYVEMKAAFSLLAVVLSVGICLWSIPDSSTLNPMAELLIRSLLHKTLPLRRRWVITISSRATGLPTRPNILPPCRLTLDPLKHFLGCFGSACSRNNITNNKTDPQPDEAEIGSFPIPDSTIDKQDWHFNIVDLVNIVSRG